MLGLSARLEQRISPEPNTGCWLWTGRMNAAGYGRIHFKRRIDKLAHRVVYTEARGDIPAGLDLDHLCRVRSCVNPDHLEPVTRAENLRRSPLVGHVRPYQTHCKQGHPLSGRNLRIEGGWRKCKACSVRWSAEYRVRVKANQKANAEV